MLKRAITVGCLFAVAVSLIDAAALAASSEPNASFAGSASGNASSSTRGQIRSDFRSGNPRDPNEVVVSYQQAVDAGCDHDPGVSVKARVARSADGGITWQVADGTTHSGYLRAMDTATAYDLHGHAFLIYIGMDEMKFMSPNSGAWIISRARPVGRCLPWIHGTPADCLLRGVLPQR